MDTNQKSPFKIMDVTADIKALSAQGKADAISGRPASSDTTLPGVFVDRQVKLKTFYAEGVGNCQDELDQIEKKIDVLYQAFDASSLKSKASNLIFNMVTKISTSNHKSKTNFNRAEFQRRKADFERFKIKNDRVFDPERGTSERTFIGLSLSVWVLLSLYIMESFFNAGLFISEVGLIGGLTISLSTSLVNVVVGFLVGRFVFSCIYLHPNILTKIVSLVLFLSFAFTVVYMNLMIAVYRSLKAIENTYQTVNTSDAAWPFPHMGQLDFDSTLVLLVGFVFAIAALLDGYFSDDPYPGYGHKYRLCIKARNAVQKELHAYKTNMMDGISSTKEELQKMFGEASSATVLWSAEVNTIQRRFVDYKEWVSQLAGWQKLFWKSYCSAHASHRLLGYQAPDIFDQEPDLFVSDTAMNPQHVFDDAKHYYMTDQERLTRAASYDTAAKQVSSEVGDSVEKQINELKQELKIIEQNAVCHI